MHEGHRKRMLQRLEIGEDTLQDHEKLEILLFNAVPRKNTNDIAHELLIAFGSLDAVFRADFAKLKTVKGVGDEVAAYLRCIGLIMRQKPVSEPDYPKNLSPERMKDFLMDRYALLTEEILEIFCVNKNNKITHCKRFTDFSDNEVSIDVQNLTELFAAEKPYCIVIAHNHPDCTCRPSRKDDRFTIQVTLFCQASNVKLYDHMITGIDGVYSYHGERRLENFRNKFDIPSLIDKTLKF